MKHLTSKILLLGDQGVGKSTLALRMISDANLVNLSPTVGVSYLETIVEVGDYVITLQLWDTAGQERFKAMIPMYYRNSSGALVVYDVTDKNSFLAVQKWVEELRTHGEEELEIFVVGNKYDSKHTKRSVNQSEAAAFARAIGGHFCEVSALSNAGINELKLDICLKLVHYNQRLKMSNSSYEEVVSNDEAVYLKRKRTMTNSSVFSNRERCCF